jgi:hypothetical protein
MSFLHRIMIGGIFDVKLFKAINNPNFYITNWIHINIRKI